MHDFDMALADRDLQVGVHGRLALRLAVDGKGGERRRRLDENEAGLLGGFRGLGRRGQWVEDLPEWPFEGPASGRIALFVVIPVASWTAAALVERVVSRLLG